MRRKYSKGFGIVELAVVFVAVTIVTVLGWVFWTKIINSPAVEMQAEESRTERRQTATTLKPAEVTDQIKTILGKKYAIVETNNKDDLKEMELGVVTNKAAAPYRVQGYDFFVSPTEGSSLFFLPSTASEKAIEGGTQSVEPTFLSEIVAVFEDLGLSKDDSHEAEEGEEGYRGKGLFCSVRLLGKESGAYVAECGSLDTYKKTAEDAKPLVAAFPEMGSAIMVSGLTIEDSPVAEYKRASVGINQRGGVGGAIALFYKKGSDEWVYFRYTQNDLPCMVYNTDDVKAAFKGKACYAVSGQISKVQ